MLICGFLGNRLNKFCFRLFSFVGPHFTYNSLKGMSQGKRTIQTKLNFSRISSTPPTSSLASTSEDKIKKRRLSEDSSASEISHDMASMDYKRRPDGHSAAREPDKYFAKGSSSVKDSDKNESEEPFFETPSSSHKTQDGSQDLFDEEEDMDASEIDLPEDLDDSWEKVERTEDFYPRKRIESEKPQASSQGTRIPVDELRTAPKCHKGKENKLRPSELVQVMFHVPPNDWVDKPLKPHPYSFQDTWSESFVYMPCSPKSQIPKPEMQDGTRSRWEVIEEALTSRMSSSFDIAEAIFTYNSHYRKKWNFDNLHHLFKELLSEQRMDIVGETLPKMAELALQLPRNCTKSIPLLKKYQKKKLVLSQQQVACLLANAFFCTFPRRNFKVKGPLPDINFSSLFNGPRNPRKIEKLKCIFNYFDRVTKNMPNGVVSYERQVLFLPHPKWHEVNERFTRMCVSSQGTIEDDGVGMLQADFANKYVGGGVLGRGCVQEEIRFIICPEMILSRLFTEVLQDNEVLIMTGCEQYSDYSGYADTFRFEGNHVDDTVRDKWGRRCTEVVAMDALVVRQYKDQFALDKVCRELNKAYCAFKGSEYHRDLSAVSTGNWGCGAFGGDKHLKALIQWMAATKAGREIVFFTFGDERLSRELEHFHEMVKSSGCRVGQTMRFIKDYNNAELRSNFGKPRISLFEYICTELGGGWIGKSPRTSSYDSSVDYSSQDFQSQDYKANTP